MGLRINTNVDALDAYRNLSMTQSRLSDSLQKLSSGYRINKAADDAAGLSISEGLQSQIGGLTQAVKNAQDGINVVQTADGALTEVDSILQRMNDLAVQAANSGSQDASARQAAQTEINQLNTDLDNIGSTTQFGQSKLLDGSFGLQAAVATGAQVDISTANTKFDIQLVKDNGSGTATADGSAVTIDGTKNVDGSTATYTNDAAGAALLQTNLQHQIDTASSGALKGKVTAVVSYDSLTKATSISFARTSASTTNDKIYVGDNGDTDNSNDAAQAFGWMDTSSGIAAGDNETGDKVTGGGGVFQIGAEAGQTQSVSIGAVSSTALGTNQIDLVNNASTAITTIQSAISQISTLRSNLGAYQNGFQHTINNLNVTVENLQSSNSSIQDTDMASQMVQFTQQQVLQQAGVSMLAQANSESQSVLKLLG